MCSAVSCLEGIACTMRLTSLEGLCNLVAGNTDHTFMHQLERCCKALDCFHRRGPLDVSHLNSLLRRRLVIDTNPKEAMGNEEDLSTLPQCGFWLPHGMGLQDFVVSWWMRHSEMKRLYPTVTNQQRPGDPDVESAVARLLVLEDCGFPFAVRLTEPYS